MATQLITFLVLLVAFILFDWATIYLGTPINHPRHQALRTLVWLILAIAFQSYWADKVMYFVAYHFAFWLPFDLGLNLLRGKPWNYLGKGTDAALTDQISREWPAAAWGLKTILFLIGIGTLVFGTYW